MTRCPGVPERSGGSSPGLDAWYISMSTIQSRDKGIFSARLCLNPLACDAKVKVALAMELGHEQRLACHVIDAIADAVGINILTSRIGLNAEGGWELVAWSNASAQQWTVTADRLYDAACELADLVGFQLDDG